MITISLSNQKGGVGKTSLTRDIAGALADEGHLVLVVDQDPQASATQGFEGSDEAGGIPPDLTAWAIAEGRNPDPRELIRTFAAGGFDFVPGSPALAEHNLANPLDLEDLTPMRRFLAEAAEAGRYRYCLIDTPPNLQLLTASAWAASEFVVVPVPPEDYGAQGIGPVTRFLAEVARDVNPCLKLAGILINLREAQLAVHRTYEARIRREYGDLVFEAVGIKAAAVKEAATMRSTVTRNDPRCKAAEAIRSIAAELVRRAGGGLP